MAPVILITGGGSGIGRAIAELFATKGYRIVITGRTQVKLDATAKAIEARRDGQATSVECWPIVLDVGQAQEVIKMVEQVRARWGSIDVLVNNAGLALGSPRPFYEQTIEDIDTVLQTNVMGTLYVSHAVLQRCMMPRAKGGQGTIVNISSITGLAAPPMGEATYHTSKCAMEGFSNVLRHECSGSNVRVLVVRPGFVGGQTNFHANRLGDDQDAAQEVFEGLEPLLETDVAQAVAYLVDAPERVSIRAIDVVPTPQRSLYINDRTWNERNDIRDK